MLLRQLRGPLGALLLVAAVLAAWWPRAPVQPLGVFDQPFYLGMAQDLRDTGRFTDGYVFATPGPDGTRPSGMRFAPLYPAMLAGLASLDPALARSMRCEVSTRGKDPACPRAAPSVRGLQGAMLAGVFLLVWWTAGAAAGSRRAGWLALLLALPVAGLLLDSVNYLMTETTTLLFTTAAGACAVRALRGGGPAWAGAAGVLLGLAAMTRPAFLYLAYAAVPCVLLLAAWWRARPLALAGLLLAAGVALPVGPWVARNALVLGRPALTYGYDSHTLVQRIAFDGMTWGEYGRSFVCWLPDGNATGRWLWGAGACGRFGWSDRPDTFYEIGQGPLMQETLHAAGGWEHHLRFLLTHFILREPLWHAAVTLPLALRGAWVAHYWGFVLAPCCLWLTVAALRRLWREGRTPERSKSLFSLEKKRQKDFYPHGNERDADVVTYRQKFLGSFIRTRKPLRAFTTQGSELSEGGTRAAALLALALPAWFMLLFNAAVAVNQVRYNLMLIPPFALSGALLVERALRRTMRHGRGTPSLPWRGPPRRGRLSGSARLNAAGRRRS